MKEDGVEEGVEVVLGEKGSSDRVVDSPTRRNSQNVFRAPTHHPSQAVRPRAMRAPMYPPYYQPYMHHSGSWGYHHPPPPPHPHYGGYPHHGGYPAPTPGSGSFEHEPSHHHPHPAHSHHSPHIKYQGPPYEEPNVITPQHKVSGPHYRPPITPRARAPPGGAYYHYPPTSPVSRPEQDQTDKSKRGPYSRLTRDSPTEEERPRIVAESFDSEKASHYSPQHGAYPPGPPVHDPYSFYGSGSWASFDSGMGPPPPRYDGPRYYGHPPYSPGYGAVYSPGGVYGAESFPPPYGPAPSYSFSFDEDEHRMLSEEQKRIQAHQGPKGRKTPVTSNTKRSLKGKDREDAMPEAAKEVDFDIFAPPSEPVTEPSTEAICGSLAEVNHYDVLCGRGGGTNSQIGNRRFRQLVQEFQPVYLLARRKEKPLLARTIVLIIRKRGGHFLKKDEETGELFEVGDLKAEAKTSQALREGLDVRATKTTASGLDEKKQKSSPSRKVVDSPPSLPKLADGRAQGRAPSPESGVFRKRRRVRTPPTSKFFPEFCPPQPDIRRAGETEKEPQPGCAGIALDVVTGAASGSFCLGPTSWRR